MLYTLSLGLSNIPADFLCGKADVFWLYFLLDELNKKIEQRNFRIRGDGDHITVVCHFLSMQHYMLKITRKRFYVLFKTCDYLRNNSC